MGSHKDNQEGVGFSGISSLLPDDPPDETAQQPIPEAGGGGSRPVASRPSANTSVSPPAFPDPSSAPQSKQPTARQRSGGGAKWVWVGIAAAIFVIWAASQSGTQPGGQSVPQPQVVQTDSSPEPSTPGQDEQANVTLAITSQPAAPELKTPPVGSGNVFSVAEIRYCLALKQRVEGAKPVVDNAYSQGQVDRFNAMVDDYNGRCHDFRYYRGALEQAQHDVAPYAKQYQAEGRQAVRGRSTDSAAARRANQPPAADAMTRAAQRALSLLGYNIGVPDGIMGPNTQAAVVSFQRANGLAETGKLDTQLINALNSATLQSDTPPPDTRTTQQPPAANDSPWPSVPGDTYLQVGQDSPSASTSRNLRTCLEGRYPSICNHSVLTVTQAVAVDAAERRANLQTCMEGRYPSICNHSLLTGTQAIDVDVAEKRANLQTCMKGQYPSICNHSLLTHTQAVDVDTAEKRANLTTCMEGRYPSICNHSLLNSAQAIDVDVAERRVNLQTCMEGRYPSICNHSLLTSQEAVEVRGAEVRSAAGG